MEYNRLISVTGLTGLFELQSSKQDGAIVKSLTDGKSTFISSRKHQFSHLEGIEVYTNTDNVNLVAVFKAMQNSTETLPNPKDDAAVRTYFKTVYPTMDLERVYISDNRKMVKWFAAIAENKIALPTEALADKDAPAEAEAATTALVDVASDAVLEASNPKKVAVKKEALPIDETEGNVATIADETPAKPKKVTKQKTEK